MKRLILPLMMTLPVMAFAQNAPKGDNLARTPAVEKRAVIAAKGALLRGLDKVTGQSRDLPLAVGETVQFGRLNVLLGQCRQPKNDPESDAFAELTITDRESGKGEFTGWMVASSPALSALDDARYDVWVVTCNDGTKTVTPDIEYVPEPEGPVAGGEGQAPPSGDTAAPANGGDQGADTGDDPVILPTTPVN